MRIWILASAFAAMAVLSGSISADDAVRITAINFKGTVDPNQLEIVADHPIQVQKRVNSEDKQIVLEIANATLDKGIGRSIDTSSFNSKIALISPYSIQGPAPSVRIVIQLRENIDADLALSGSSAVLSVPVAGVSGDKTQASASSNAGDSAVAPVPGASSEASDSDVVLEKPASQNSALAVTPQPTSTGAAAEMDTLIAATKNKKFSARPITLQARDVDLQDIFNLIADASGFNVILSNGVHGTISANLVDVPWDQVLDQVLQNSKLAAERHGNILNIMTEQEMLDKQKMAVVTRAATQAITPRITRVFPINYASLGTLSSLLLQLAQVEATTKAQIAAATPSTPALPTPPVVVAGGQATPAAGATGTATPAPQATLPPLNPFGTTAPAAPAANQAATELPLVIVQDERTNSLIVRGIPEYVERAKRIIDILDVQTPQILIEGKVVEATEAFANGINGASAAIVNGGKLPLQFNGGSPATQLFSLAGSVGGASSSSSNGIPAVTGNSVGGPGSFGTGYTIFPNGNLINAVLTVGESETRAKLIASPRAIVLNKGTATIAESIPALVPTTTVSNGVASISFSQVSGNLSLSIQPSVTSEGSVLLNVSLSSDIVQAVANEGSTVATRQVNTSVLVDSGSTLVLGGFYRTAESDSSAGVPFLRKIPILGWLFGSTVHNNDRSELMFFVTPHILNAKRAGYGAGVGST